jgi:hypothetical protein
LIGYVRGQELHRAAPTGWLCDSALSIGLARGSVRFLGAGSGSGGHWIVSLECSAVASCGELEATWRRVEDEFLHSESKASGPADRPGGTACEPGHKARRSSAPGRGPSLAAHSSPPQLVSPIPHLPNPPPIE